jgi:hypothetical protein
VQWHIGEWQSFPIHMTNDRIAGPKRTLDSADSMTANDPYRTRSRPMKMAFFRRPEMA